MQVLLASLGTDGDINPFVGIGAELKSRGHSATLLASETYGSLAAANGLGFQSLVSAEENEELFSHPDFWHPLKTAKLSADWGRRFLARQYELLKKLVTSDTVIITNPGVLAALLVHETHRCPIATLVLQPWMLPSLIAPPVMPGLSFLQSAPPWVWRFFWWSLDGLGGVLIGKELNRLRASLGLKPMRRIFHNWLSPQLVLGMFPEWYGPPQADWPRQLRLIDFPLFGGSSQFDLPASVIEFCHAGVPPVAFTFGTGMRHSAELFLKAAEAVRLGGQRAIFLTRHRDQLPEPLPSSILHCEFAPFAKLFPLCSAVVHHGGIGTVSQAMAAGTPQLVLPICFDQEDNGTRVKRLGVGAMLRAGQRRPQAIARALAGLGRPAISAACHAFAGRLADRTALARAATEIELLRQQPRSTLPSAAGR